jgi:predicted phage terminase large subunit-like protein
MTMNGMRLDVASADAVALRTAREQLLAEIAEEERQARLEATRNNLEQVRERCRTLAGFTREAWHVLEPNTQYVHGWHIDAICEHLEATTAGELNRLLINVPPGSMKSLLTSVMWQAWEWGPKGMPSLRHLSTAFNDGPVKRDTRKTRDLIDSEWFRMLWPEVRLVRKAEMSFANNHTGTREGVAFSSLTSQRGDRLVIDDPHSTETAESDVERANTARRFREGAQNRLNDQEKSAIVVIMQRLHQEDISGTIEHYNMDYVHLMIPMEFEPARKCYTRIGWEDPRSQDGELMDPVRFPRRVLDRLQSDMTEYAIAGQYQQRPAPREGGLFKPDNIEKIDSVPADAYEFVRGWDLAGSKRKTSPYTASVKLARSGPYIIICDVTRVRKSVGLAEKHVEDTTKDDANRHGSDVAVLQDLPQDPGSAGKSQKLHLGGKLQGYRYRFTPERGSKEARAEVVAAPIENGQFLMVRAPWNSEFIDEMRNFPSGRYKDQVDAMSRAYAALLGTFTDEPGEGAEVPEESDEHDTDISELLDEGDVYC